MIKARARTLLLAVVATLAVAGAGLGVTVSRDATDPESAVAATWPRPYDPALPLDLSGVPGVSGEQKQRALALIEASRAAATLWTDYDKVRASGWSSFGDALAGFEHLINRDLVDDDYLLDPTRPESLVYRVDGDKRELIAYMFLARSGQALDDPELLGYAGRLMEWHNHADLCMRYVDGDPVAKIAGFAKPDGTCEMPGAVPAAQADAAHAMVHVWLVANDCGPFAALEGAARGTTLTAAGDRVDVCH